MSNNDLTINILGNKAYLLRKSVNVTINTTWGSLYYSPIIIDISELGLVNLPTYVFIQPITASAGGWITNCGLSADKITTNYVSPSNNPNPASLVLSILIIE